jgi:ATP-dependent helicase HrpA
MRLELITELIRTLPKSLRRQVGPAPDLAAKILTSVTPRSRPLTEAVASEIRASTGADVSSGDLRFNALPEHLRMTFTAVATDGEVLGRSKSLRELQDRLAGKSRAALEREAGTVSRPAATAWTAETFGDISRTLRSTVAGQEITSYPALSRRGKGFAVVAAATEAEQAANMYNAVVELILAGVPPLRPSSTSALSTTERLALSQSPYPDTAALLADCVRAAVIDLVPNPPNVWTAAEFAALRGHVAGQATRRATDKLRKVATILTRVAPLHGAIAAAGTSVAADDVRDQVDELLFDGFISATKDEHLAEIPRYLDAARSRLEQLPASATRDAQATAAIDRVVGAWTDHLRHVPPNRRDAVNEQASWIVEELRVGLFAQQFRTAYPVSEKRAIRAIRELT